MANALHSRQTTDDGIHIPYAFTYADAAARTSDSSRTSVDIGKFARQLDDNSIWMLVSIAPTWATVGSASGSYAPLSRSINAGSGLTGGGDLSADRTLSVVVDPSGSISVVSGALQVGILTADSQHGILGGGSLHAVATTGSSGFLSFSDKIKLDGIASGSTNTPLTNTSPVDVTRSTSQVGVSTEAARSDHKHDVSTAAPVILVIGGSNSEGVSSSLSRSDHVHALPPFGSVTGSIAEGNDTRLTDDRIAYAIRTATSVVYVSSSAAPSSGSILVGVSSTQAQWEPRIYLSDVAAQNLIKSSSTAGTSSTAARSDHKHDIVTDVGGTWTIGSSAAEGTSTSLARADHVHLVASPSAPADVTKAAASAGVSTAPARSDHKHDISTSTPVAVGTGSIEGTSTSLARADHVHDHASVRQLIHFINDGPAEGYATGPYREALPAGSPFPTSITWWTSATKLHKIVEKTITRATNKFPTSISWMMYDSGDVVTVTVTDTYDYSSGILTPTVTRTIT